MEAALRKKRIEYYRTKIAASQQEYIELIGKLFTPDLTMEDRTAISRIIGETTKRCDYLRYMLGLYEYQCESEEVLGSD
jgi:hypothetical protein